MNTTITNLQTTDSQTSNTNGKKAFFSTHMLEKKSPMKSLSLRPSRSVKKTSSIKPMPVKKV